MKHLTLFVCLLAAGWSVASAQTDFTWTGVVDTNWSTGGNWDDGGGGGGPPAATDNAIFDTVVGGGTVVVGTASINDATVLGGGGWTFNAAGDTLTVGGTFDYASSGNSNMYAALGGTGTLQLTGPGMLILRAANSYGATMINGGTLQLETGATLGTGTVTINTGGTLQFRRGYTGAQNFVLNGGNLDRVPDWATQTLTGSIDVQADSKILGGTSNFENWMNLDGAIAAAGKITYEGYDGQTGGQGMPLAVRAANNTNSGGWDIQSGRVVVVGVNRGVDSATDALGTGTVTVRAGHWVSTNNGNNGYYGGLVLFADQPSVPAIIVEDGGMLALNSDGGAAWDEHLTTPIILNGGALCGSNSFWAYPGGTTYVDGGVTMTADSYLRIKGSTLVINSAIVESGGSYKLIKDFCSGQATLAVANTYTGGTDVLYGQLNVDAAGALGSGSVYVANGGILRTNADDALLSVPMVTVDGAGTLNLNSTESGMNVLVKAGGGFQVSGGSTVLDYAIGTGNINVEAGAVLGETVSPMPDLTDLLPGDGGFGVFKSATSGTHTVGSASGTIFRGIATTVNTTFSGTVVEAATGTDGVGTLAVAPGNYTYNGATLTAYGSNSIKFYGNGGHIIAGTTNSFNNDLERFGTGMLRIDTLDAIAGKTLNMYGGWLNLNAADALNGAVVNLKSPSANGLGGVFVQDTGLGATAGTINVEPGAGVVLWGDWDSINTDLAPRGATFNFSPGSQLVLVFNGWDPGVGDIDPAQGKADFLFKGNDGRALGLSPTVFPTLGSYPGRLLMSEETRMTITSNFGATPGNGFYDHRIGQPADAVVLAPDETYTRMCGPTGLILAVGAQVDLTGSGTFGGIGTLLVGDPNTYWATVLTNSNDVNNHLTGKWEIGQDGEVRLENDGNIIGAFDIQAGILRVDNTARLGGATTASIADAATLRLDYDDPDIAMTLTGNGTVLVGEGGSGTSTLTLTPTASTAADISPGASAGALTVTGNLTMNNDGGGNYAGLNVEVLTDGNVAGTDHDALAVTGTANVSAGELVVALPLPGPGLAPSTPDWSTPDLNDVVVRNLGDMTVVTAGTVTGPFAVETLGATIGVDANPAMPGEQPDNHYMLAAGAVLADYSSGTDVVVKGADILWMGMPGDANLDDSCDVSDLSLLAGTFRTSNPYFAPGSGGSPVPEPVTLVLLGLGGIGLVARRRRK